jgi:hypothetical protein
LKPLAPIWNVSYTSGIFPDRLKIAKVKPFYNKGDNILVSTLAVFSKILEKVMCNSLIYYVGKTIY